ncbi:MAG: phenylacetate--CoA ligase family protein [Gemmataceae bacterium]
MLDTLNRHLVQPAIAAKRRSAVFRHLKQLERTQFDTPEVVRARQLAMLQTQLRHAYATVPFYRRTWAAAAVHPDDVKTLEDFRHFPVVTKTDIRKHAAEMLSEAYRGKKLRTKTTSGSTGVPLAIKLDERGAQWKAACTLRADEWSGWRLGQRVAKVWGNPEYRHFGLRGRLANHFVDRAVYLDTINLTEDRIREFVAAVRRHRPGLVFGHAHSLYMLACALNKSGVADIRPNGVISTAMPLHDYQRKAIEQALGVPVTNRYGCEEVSLIACQCERHRGLHVAAESVFVEVKGAGATGPLLVTDLSNFAMPLIRYQIGDVATLSDTPCECGRGLPVLEKVEGRDADYVVTPAGSLISGISLTENFAVLIKGAAQVQIIQETVTHLRVRMVRDPIFDAESEQQIRQLVLNTFGPTMTCDLEFVDLIPQEPSGKYRFCVSKVSAEYLKGLSA